MIFEVCHKDTNILENFYLSDMKMKTIRKSIQNFSVKNNK
jgi:hypothetical protein